MSEVTSVPATASWTKRDVATDVAWRFNASPKRVAHDADGNAVLVEYEATLSKHEPVAEDDVDYEPPPGATNRTLSITVNGDVRSARLMTVWGTSGVTLDGALSWADDVMEANP